MQPLRFAVFALLVVLLLGIGLIAIPYSGPKYLETIREGVECHIEEDGLAGSMTTFDDLRRGTYEVWAVDINPGVFDHGGIDFEVERNDETIKVERSQREITRELDGTRYEVVWRFDISRGGLYSYGFMPFDPGLNGTYYEFIFMRQATRLDQPTFIIGLALTVTALVCVPIAFYVMKRQPRRPVIDGVPAPSPSA